MAKIDSNDIWKIQQEIERNKACDPYLRRQAQLEREKQAEAYRKALRQEEESKREPSSFELILFVGLLLFGIIVYIFDL